jgi:serine/threonine protein kinase/WD40 repeat protein
MLARMGKDDRHRTWASLSGEADDASRLDARTVTPETTGRYQPSDGPDELGRGGIGRVIAVVDAHLGREVARKELLAANKPIHLARFLREARVTANLEHPNIVPVYELGEAADGRLYYTMRKVRGRTLRDALDAADGLDGRLALLDHFVDLCHAIAYAHAFGVIHRDIKPDNVMVGEFGETVVLDWGLAKVRGQADLREEDLSLASRVARPKTAAPPMAAAPVPGSRPEPAAEPTPTLPSGPVPLHVGPRLKLPDSGDLVTQQGVTLGTPAYMSPEQARGDVDRIDERSDVWSLGAVLYQVLSGHPPFDGEVDTILDHVRTGAVPPIARRVPEAPRALLAIVDRALSPDPAHRYANAKELAADVVAFQTDASVRAYRYTLRDQLAWFVRRHKELVGTVAVAAVVLLGVAGWAYHRVSAARDVAVAAEASLRAKDEKTRADLAKALTASGVDQMTHHEQPTARVLAAEALVLGDSPLARGVLVGATSAWQPVLAWTTVLPTRSGCEMLKLSPDDARLACSTFVDLHVWDRATGLERSWPIADTYGWGLAWLPDGRHIAVGGEDAVRIVDTDDGSVTRLDNAGAIALSIAAFPDGRLVVGGDDGTIRVWAPDGAALGAARAHEAWIFAVAPSPDGATIASAGSDHAVKLWDAAALAERPPLDHHGVGGTSLAWLGDRTLAVGNWTEDDAAVRLWDTTTGHAVTVGGTDAEVSGLAASGDGRYAIAASADGTAVVWAPDGVRLGPIPPAEAVMQNVAVSSDGRVAVIATGTRLREWTMPATLAADTLVAHERQVASAWWTPSGPVTVGDDGQLVRWDVANGRPDVRRTLAPEGLWGVAQQGDVLVVGSRRGLVFGLDATTLDTRWSVTVGTQIDDAIPTRDGGLLVVGDGIAARLDPATGAVLASADLGAIAPSAVAEAPDALVVSAEYDAFLLELDPVTLAERARYPIPDVDAIWDVAVAPDGSTLVVGDEHGGVHLWDWPARREVRKLDAHGDRVTAVVYSPDGRLLASGGEDGQLVVWDTATWAPLARIPAHGTRAIWAIAWSPDGERVISAGGDALVRVWSTSTLHQPATDAVASARRELGLVVVDGDVAFDPTWPR